MMEFVLSCCGFLSLPCLFDLVSFLCGGGGCFVLSRQVTATVPPLFSFLQLAPAFFLSPCASMCVFRHVIFSKVF